MNLATLPAAGVTGMLASVTCSEEALIALHGRADIIDLKDPARGALGALDDDVVRDIVCHVAGRLPVSATVGDLTAMIPGELVVAAARMAANGVDYVKVGFFPTPAAGACIAALAPLATDGVRLIAVMFGDLGLADYDIGEFAAAGFAGVMVDTATKGGGSIRHYLPEAELRRFVAAARAAGLLTGLAGSLRLPDIAPLLALRPDYLGFRGALCAAGTRTAGIDALAFASVRAAVSTPPRAAVTTPA